MITDNQLTILFYSPTLFVWPIRCPARAQERTFGRGFELFRLSFRKFTRNAGLPQLLGPRALHRCPLFERRNLDIP